MILHKTLKQLIKDKGITAGRLAKETKVPQQTIYNWMEGRKPRDITKLKSVARYFEVSIDFLCFGEEIKIKQEKGFVEFEEEINAGVFEVVLRRVKKKIP